MLYIYINMEIKYYEQKLKYFEKFLKVHKIVSIICKCVIIAIILSEKFWKVLKSSEKFWKVVKSSEKYIKLWKSFVFVILWLSLHLKSD